MRIPRVFRTSFVVFILVVLSACGAQPATVAPTIAPTQVASGASTAPSPTAATAGMDHGSMAMSDAPFDAQFIDSMIVHHESAVTMAKQAQSQAQRPEITQLAAAIISAQEAEIAQMKQWRSMWYPDLAPTMGMGMPMGAMEVPAGTTPFEQRFLESMIPHHEGAIMMANAALEKAEHPEIKALAQAIVSAQNSEITQMKQWLKDWYGIAR